MAGEHLERHPPLEDGVLGQEDHADGARPGPVEHAVRPAHQPGQVPGERPPACRVALSYGPTVEIALALDTVIVDTDASRVTLLYRGHVALRNGPHDVRSIHLGNEGQSRSVQGNGEARWA